MPPKRVAKPKLHQLAVELPVKTIISDLSTKKQYCIGKQFATGGFGRIYTCNEVGTKKELVVKVEPYGNGPLFTEANVFLRILKPDQIASYMREKKLARLGVPAMISCGVHQYGDNKLRFLIIPKYSTSLESIREKKRVFTETEVWTIARCMLQSLEYVHEKNYTHADIKAGNILLEKQDDFSTSVLVDYGLAHLSTRNEDKADKKRAHNGTAIFTSCDAHRGYSPSYRGDLEILAYNMVYWLSGSLPWEAQESNPEKVLRLKETFLEGLPSTLKDLLKATPSSVAPLCEIFKIALKTKYLDRLDYPKLYKIVENVLKDRAVGVKRKMPKVETNEEEHVIQTPPPKAKRMSPNPSFGDDEPYADAVASSSCSPMSKENEPGSVKPRKLHLKPRSGQLSDIRIIRNTRLERRFPIPEVAELRPEEGDPSSSSRTSPRGVVPGLSVRRAPCVPLNSTSSSMEGGDLSTSTGFHSNGQETGVSPATKQCPNKLRNIPGMQNFARGRRSIVIDQINKKYRRIAEKKKLST
ncbi:unnamed protein product [Nippostrongylus brasiliensis]|uniref:non-specific serine/threonine protein kinase n=1 Tax=Nippostrongylus brasiliensis TaxID=27835 RepID=A0A0N4YSI6_NIPBR|nr:unnamed protein product [Nippostrongylus brasiliensis]